MNDFDFQLQARVNVVVKAVEDERTSVRVHGRYVFGNYKFGSYMFETASEHTRTIWIPKRTTRTCMPTHRAENTLLATVQLE